MTKLITKRRPELLTYEYRILRRDQALALGDFAAARCWQQDINYSLAMKRYWASSRAAARRAGGVAAKAHSDAMKRYWASPEGRQRRARDAERRALPSAVASNVIPFPNHRRNAASAIDGGPKK